MQVTNSFTPAATTWRWAASDGTDYASLAALQAAGKTCWPGLINQGMHPTSGVVFTRTSAGAAGSGAFIRFDPPAGWDALSSDAARDALAEEVFGSGQQYVTGGLIDTVSQEFIALAFRLLASSDALVATAKI